MTKSTEFGILLTDAIYRISSCEADKALSVIHDELGYVLDREGGSAIYYWRRGNVPKLADVEKLAKEIIQRSDLDKEWLQAFLESAEHPYAIGLCNELFPNQATVSSIEPTDDVMTKPNTNRVPKKTYSQLVGRAALVQEALNTLADSNGRWLVSIDGIGGIGKTAVAHAIACTAIKKQIFDTVVWVDTLAESGTDHDNNGDRVFSFEEILDSIADQLGEQSFAKLSISEKERHIQFLLDTHRVLIVIDGLERTTESQMSISRKLERLLGTSKALLVSRYRFRGNLYTIHLGGLNVDESIQFIRQEAKERRIRRVEVATDEELEKIAMSTGGSPLAIKLVIGQLEHLPIEVVLKHLHKAKPMTNDLDNDEYFYLYNSIYAPFWGRLSEAGQKLLHSVVEYGPHTDISLDTLRSVCTNLNEDDITCCINELWQFSLMDTVESTSADLGKIRYNLHALTRYFVPSSRMIQM